ncbi:hypothetical protein PInf_018531 [Phytophthora infestans]|nr:hypothetical protein PInf_018531 [Phytophthora infestans]
MNIANEDDMLTLDEALEFIAFCDGPGPTSKLQDCRHSFTIESIDELHDPLAPGPESMNLEAHLADLSRSGGQKKPLAITKGDELVSEWHRHAFSQYQRRHDSEQSNRQLRGLWDKQQKLANKLRRALFKRNVLTGMEFVRIFESPTFETSRGGMINDDELMIQLEEEVNSVYFNFHRIYQPLVASMVYGSSSETFYDEKRTSNATEITTITPLDWPIRDAFDHLWGSLESSSDRSRKPNTLETRVNLIIPVPKAASCHFHKLDFMRKYEEHHRIIVIWADLMQMTSKNIRLRSLAHAVFTPSKIDPSNASVMNTFVKLYVEPTSG